MWLTRKLTEALKLYNRALKIDEREALDQYLINRREVAVRC